MEPRWGLQYAHKTDAFSDTQWWARDARVMLAHMPATGRVMEVGCGTGRLLGMMAARWPGRELIGVDPNHHGLGLAARRCPSARLITDMGTVQDESIAVCPIMHALPQVEHPETMLTQLWDKMIPGGTILVVVHNRTYGRMRVWDRLHGYKDDPTITTHFTRGSLGQMLRDAGFRAEISTCFGDGLGGLPFLRPRILVVARRPT